MSREATRSVRSADAPGSKATGTCFDAGNANRGDKAHNLGTLRGRKSLPRYHMKNCSNLTGDLPELTNRDLEWLRGVGIETYELKVEATEFKKTGQVLAPYPLVEGPVFLEYLYKDRCGE